MNPLSLLLLTAVVAVVGQVCSVAFEGRVSTGTCTASACTAPTTLRTFGVAACAGRVCCTEDAPCSNGGWCLDRDLCESNPDRVAVPSSGGVGARGCGAYPTAIQCCQFKATVAPTPATLPDATVTEIARSTPAIGTLDTAVLVTTLATTTTTTTTITTTDALFEPTSSVAAPDDEPANLGIIVGAAVGGAVALLLVAVLVVLVLRCNGKKTPRDEPNDSKIALQYSDVPRGVPGYTSGTLSTSSQASYTPAPAPVPREQQYDFLVSKPAYDSLRLADGSQSLQLQYSTYADAPTLLPSSTVN